MRIVIVCEAMGPSLDAAGSAAGLAGGWSARAPHDTVETYPLSGGGPGFVDVVGATVPVATAPVVVHGPDGREVPAQVSVANDGGVRTAYLDASEAAGRHLVLESDLRDPRGLTSAGVGELLLAARELGVDRIVVGVSDLACHDAGSGVLQALGAGDDLAGLPEVVKRWSSIPLVLASGDDLPLTGFHGASAALGTSHGVPAETTQALERQVGDVVAQVDRVVPPSTDLLSGAPRRPERAAGAGCGGGVGYALQRLGAHTVPAARLLLDELGVTPRLAGALVVLGTPAYDWRTVHGGVVAETARLALEVASPTVVLAGQVLVGRREGMALGISGTYAMRKGESLADLAARVARTWSPPPALPPQSLADEA